ncbi:single-stranded DNA-binding protein [Aggregatibacter kilianii]|uniref:single-stranded DNA-binding protein n=1 Tax=Aggregatibacter kilianii TaxID=2025884 RepID=UPI000D691E92|nr:single-stranded DNA-binding protein [Aggregatibacter kilianii]
MAYTNNLVILFGNVGKDPEITQFADGGLQATLSLATVNSYKPKDSEEWVETTDWHTVKATGNNAKQIADYVRKGHRLEVIGQLKNNNYEKDGVKHYGYIVQAQKLVFVEITKDKPEALPVKSVQSKSAE